MRRCALRRSRLHPDNRRDLTPTFDDGRVPVDVVIAGKTREQS
jgi:hypothetical protein